MVPDNHGWLPSMVAEKEGFISLAEQLKAVEDEQKVVRKETSRPTRWGEGFRGRGLESMDGCEVNLPGT